MKPNFLRFAFVLSVSLNAGVLALAAFNGYRARAERPAAAQATPVEAPSLREELRLTDEQARTFTAVRAVLHERVQALRGQMRQQREVFFRLLAAPEADSAALDRVLTGMNRTQFAMERTVADYLLAQMRHLTPEQRAAFVQSMAREASVEGEPRRLPFLGRGGARLPDDSALRPPRADTSQPQE